MESLEKQENISNKMSAFRGHCPHLDSVGEITKEDLIQKSHVRKRAFFLPLKNPLKDHIHFSPRYVFSVDYYNILCS